MTQESERDGIASSPFAGLRPTRLANVFAPAREQSRLAKSLLATMPAVLAGTLAITTMHATGTIDTGIRKPHRDDGGSSLGKSVRDAFASAAKTAAAETTPSGTVALEAVPTTYTVRGGDTVSGIATRYGLATASVLAMNGLGWKSTIFPGQVLQLSKGTPAPSAPRPVTTPSPSANANAYTIVSGDTTSGIARKLGVSLQALLQANNLQASSVIYTGKTLVVPPVATTAPASAPAAPLATATPTGSYTILAGDTLTSIANKHGLSIQALLTANGLTPASIIYAGRTLTIPTTVVAAATPAVEPLSVVAAPAAAPVAAPTTTLDAEAQANVRTIIAVGRQLGVSDYGIIIALAAAAQESGLRNLPGGDRDSVGLFQQRPSSGWGAAALLQNPSYAAKLFFGGPANPNRGITRGLLDIPGWSSMSVTQAAQAVQISAFPNAYAKWEPAARAWLAALG